MEVKRIKRAFYTALTVLAIVLGISALALLGQTSQNSEQFGRLHDLLLAVNGAGVVALVLLIAGNLIGLLRDFRRRAPGAKLKARMLTAFIGLAVAPLLVVYLFAVKFLNEGIETWFDLEIEAGLGDALSISRAALEGQMRDSLQVTQRMATVANLADDQGASRLTPWSGFHPG